MTMFTIGRHTSLNGILHSLQNNYADVSCKNFIKENKSNPFFLYWATPIPHAPLQAPKAWVDKYIEKFGDEEPYVGNKGYFPHRNPRAAYAAMVSYLDDQVGQLIQTLKALDLYGMHVRGDVWGAVSERWNDAGLSCARFDIPESKKVIVMGGALGADPGYCFRIIRVDVKQDG